MSKLHALEEKGHFSPCDITPLAHNLYATPKTCYTLGRLTASYGALKSLRVLSLMEPASLSGVRF